MTTAVLWFRRDLRLSDNPALVAAVEDADEVVGPVRSPWIAWGPYLWADGTTPRSDGLFYECSDLDDDGIHPGEGVTQKVTMLLLFT